MLNEAKKNHRDLGVPSEVESDSQSQEILRAWVAHGGLPLSGDGPRVLR